MIAMNIKQLKPNKSGPYKQGYYRCMNPDKYKGKDATDKTIIYRSSLEFRFCKLCDMSSKVLAWSSETLPIAYELDGVMHTNWPDFLFKTSYSTYIVEVKPWHETQCPSRSASNYAKETYRKNVAKWNATIAYCKQQNIKFKIITERFFK